MIPTLIIFLPHTRFIAFLCHRIASQQAAPAILLWNYSEPHSQNRCYAAFLLLMLVTSSYKYHQIFL